VKDDHGLADHAVCRFERRVEACLAAVEAVHQETGHRTLYVPNLIGTPERVRDQLRFARSAGAPAVMLSPMLLGLPSLAELATHAQLPILTHPALAGVLRAAEPALLGTPVPLVRCGRGHLPSRGRPVQLFAGNLWWDRTSAANAPRAMKPALPVPAGAFIWTGGRAGRVLRDGLHAIDGGACTRRVIAWRKPRGRWSKV
jgi:hypothetical protein